MVNRKVRDALMAHEGFHAVGTSLACTERINTWYKCRLSAIAFLLYPFALQENGYYSTIDLSTAREEA